MTKLIQVCDDAQLNLLTTVANLISVRNYLMATYNGKVDKVLYKRIGDKISLLDKQILNLALMVDVPFRIEP